MTRTERGEAGGLSPTTDAGKRLLDYILSGFEGDDDPAALVVAVERSAEAWGKFRGLEMARLSLEEREAQDAHDRSLPDENGLPQ